MIIKAFISKHPKENLIQIMFLKDLKTKTNKKIIKQIENFNYED